MKRFKILVVAILWSALIFGPSAAVGMDNNGRFYALGVGKRPCSDYVKFREKRLENFSEEQYEVAAEIIKHWVAGFLTAHNYYVTDTYNVMGNATIEEATARLESFCKANGSKFFAEAALDLARSLHAKRIKLDTANKK